MHCASGLTSITSSYRATNTIDYGDNTVAYTVCTCTLLLCVAANDLVIALQLILKPGMHCTKSLLKPMLG